MGQVFKRTINLQLGPHIPPYIPSMFKPGSNYSFVLLLFYQSLLKNSRPGKLDTRPHLVPAVRIPGGLTPP